MSGKNRSMCQKKQGGSELAKAGREVGVVLPLSIVKSLSLSVSLIVAITSNPFPWSITYSQRSFKCLFLWSIPLTIPF